MTTPHCETNPTTPATLTLGQVAHLHSKILFARALRLTRQHSLAWDLVQDTFERGLRHGAPGVPADNLRAWLMVVMKNLFLDQRRRQLRRATVLVDPHDLELLPQTPVENDPDDDPPWRAISADELRRCMGQLRPAFRDAYVLHAVSGLSYRDIALRLRIPVRTVGTRLWRARNQLRRALTQADTGRRPQRMRREALPLPLPGRMRAA